MTAAVEAMPHQPVLAGVLQSVQRLRGSDAGAQHVTLGEQLARLGQQGLRLVAAQQPDLLDRSRRHAPAMLAPRRRWPPRHPPPPAPRGPPGCLLPRLVLVVAADPGRSDRRRRSPPAADRDPPASLSPRRSPPPRRRSATPPAPGAPGPACPSSPARVSSSSCAARAARAGGQQIDRRRVEDPLLEDVGQVPAADRSSWSSR